MPRMPSDRIEGQVSNNVRPTRLTRASGAAPEARALQQVGGVVQEMGDRIRTANIQAEVVDAQFSLRDELDQAYRELERDMEGDPAEFEQRMRTKSKEIVSKVGGNMSSPMHKRLWEQASQRDVESFAIQSRDLTYKRQIDGAKAKTIEAGTKYEAVVKDPSKSRDQLEQGYTDFKGLVDAQLEAGLYTQTEAAQLKAQAEVNFKSGVSLRHVSEIDHRMDAGDFASAEEYFKTNYGEIDPARREQSESAIEVKGVEQKAVQRADAFMVDAAGDYGKALEKARKVKDVDLRLKIESRLTTMKGQDEQADALEQKDVKEGLLDHVISGGSLASAPADLVRRADAFTLDYIQQEQRQRQVWAQQMSTLTAQERAAVTQMSAIGKDHLQGFRALEPEVYMMGPEYWKTEAPHLHEAYQLLKPEHRSEIVMDIRKRQATGNTVDTTDSVFKDLIAQVPMLGPENRKGKDFSKGSDGKGSKRTYSKEEAAVRASLYQQAQEHAKRTGGADITPQESRVMIARAFREFDARRYPYDEPGRFVGELSGAVMTSPAYLTTQDFLREKLDREPTPDEVLKAMSELEE